MPPLNESEYVLTQPIKVDGNTMHIPLHVFNGDGRSVEVRASFSIDDADETIMSAALAMAVEEAREALKA